MPQQYTLLNGADLTYFQNERFTTDLNVFAEHNQISIQLVHREVIELYGM